jgi:hypothetical protein
MCAKRVFLFRDGCFPAAVMFPNSGENSESEMIMACCQAVSVEYTSNNAVIAQIVCIPGTLQDVFDREVFRHLPADLVVLVYFTEKTSRKNNVPCRSGLTISQLVV